MKVSVALCTYNGERFLAEQLASIRRQTRVPEEVVIRDDRSTDGTARIVEAFARDYSGTVDFAVNPRRLGVTANFEAALAATTGELILLSDQDDVWFPERVASALHAFEADPELFLLFADARLVDAGGRPLGSTVLQALGVSAAERRLFRSGRAFDVLAKRSMALGASSCLRRTVLRDALPIPSSWMHDEWVALIAAARGRVRCVEDPVIDYRQHDANVTDRPPMSLRELWVAVFRPRRDFRIDMVERVASLGARLQAMNAPREHLALCAEKLQHVRIRGSLPPLRPMRVVPILREAWTGRYRRCSTGWRAILVDLFGPIAMR
jgi:glycosyltransferase involved in cell wall biosynthesis